MAVPLAPFLPVAATVGAVMTAAPEAVLFFPVQAMPEVAVTAAAPLALFVPVAETEADASMTATPECVSATTVNVMKSSS